MENSAKEIGQKIRTARRAKDLSQSELAQRAGIATSYYARIERGEISASLDKYIAILKVLNLKFEDIITI